MLFKSTIKKKSFTVKENYTFDSFLLYYQKQ